MDVLTLLPEISALSTSILVTTIIVLLFIHNEWRHQRLKQYGLPGPRGYPLIGSFPEALKLGMVHAEEHWNKVYGDVVGWWRGAGLNITISDPDILKEVLVKDFSNFIDRAQPDIHANPADKFLFNATGKRWKRLRTIMSPTFSTGKLKFMSKQINLCATHLSSNLEKAAKKNISVRIKEYFGAYTMDVIASTSFGLDCDSQNNPDEPFISHARELFKPRRPLIPFVTAAIFPVTAKLFKFLGWGFFSKEVLSFFKTEIGAMIKDRKVSGLTRTDFLQLMLNAEYTDQDGRQVKAEEKKMTVDEILGNSLLFFVAGYETTATLLQFTAYELATRTDIQDRVYEEIDNELENEEPTYENVSKLRYMEQVLYEGLRMYPPITRINREAGQTRVIKGITIPKGSSVNIPIYNIQHDSRFYPDPETFDPSRFESKSSQNQINFLSFGFGNRMCLGMRLAIVEAKIALVHVLRKVEFQTCSNTKIPLVLRRSSGLTQPVDPIEIKVIARQGHHAA